MTHLNKCPYCTETLDGGQEIISCPTCGMAHHKECWDENKGCAIYGCSNAPPDEKRIDISDELKVLSARPSDGLPKMWIGYIIAGLAIVVEFLEVISQNNVNLKSAIDFNVFF
jgi:hypothetical protein